jgi:hypothetical protein
MEVVLQWLAGRPAALDGFIGGTIASVVCIWIYDRFTIARRHPPTKNGDTK